MSLILDIIVIIVAVTAIANGVRRGFVKSFMSFVSTMVAFISAWMFTPVVSSVLSEKVFSAPITGSIKSTLVSLLTSNGEGYDLSKLFEDFPDEFAELISKFGADSASLRAEYASNTSASAEVVDKFVDSISAPVVSLISNVVAFIGIFAVTLILLFIITAIIEFFAKLPVIRSANKLLGFVFGFLIAAFSVVLLCKLFPSIMSMLEPFNPKWFNDEVIQKTLIVKRVAGLNLLSMLSGLF